MKQIASLFSKYVKIQRPHEDDRVIIARILSEYLTVVVARENVRIQQGIVFVSESGPVKTKIRNEKQGILHRIQKSVRVTIVDIQ